MEKEEYESPPVSSNIGQVPSLTAHTANLVKNYMIVAFGKKIFTLVYQINQNFLF